MKRAGKFDRRLGAAVREARAREGLSQSKLGAKVGLTFQQIQKYERGANRISCATLWKLAAALGEHPGSLLAKGAG